MKHETKHETKQILKLSLVNNQHINTSFGVKRIQFLKNLIKGEKDVTSLKIAPS